MLSAFNDPRHPLLPPASAPPFTVGRFFGPQTTIDKMRELCLGARGERSILLYQLTEHVVRGLQDKDYLSEILAIRNFVAEKVRYKNDPVAMETVSDPQRLAEQILQYGRATADCDDVALLVATMARQIGREAEFVTVGFGAPNNFSHVFSRVKEPKSKRWIVLDTVAGSREATMLARVTTWKSWRID